MKRIIILLLALPLLSEAREFDPSKESGKLQIGMRSIFSSFSDDGYHGFGVGGHFRIKLGSRLNSEWFFDYITTDIGGLAKRTDYHIGWAVMYYPFNNVIEKGKFTPYIQAGHCFDYTEVMKTIPGGLKENRGSMAVSSGLGCHYNIADNFDITLSALYMLHLGKEINATIFTAPNNEQDVMITKDKANLEGHLLATLSLNVYIADLWGK